MRTRWIVVGVFLGLIFLTIIVIHDAFGRPGQWVSSGDPDIDKWFSEQKVLGTNQRCCDLGDGKFVEEDIRAGVDGKSQYWARWEETKGEWIPVPEDRVINGSNKWGQPAVWWERDSDGSIYVKCYAPGAKG